MQVGLSFSTLQVDPRPVWFKLYNFQPDHRTIKFQTCKGDIVIIKLWHFSPPPYHHHHGHGHHHHRQEVNVMRRLSENRGRNISSKTFPFSKKHLGKRLFTCRLYTLCQKTKQNQTRKHFENTLLPRYLIFKD